MDYEQKELLQPIWSNMTTLLGGFKCHLEDSESNQWSEFLRETPQWKALKEIEVEAQEEIGMDLENAREFAKALVRKQQAIKDECYEIGKKWFADLVEKRRAARDEKRAAKEAS